LEQFSEWATRKRHDKNRPAKPGIIPATA